MSCSSSAVSKKQALGEGTLVTMARGTFLSALLCLSALPREAAAVKRIQAKVNPPEGHGGTSLLPGSDPTLLLTGAAQSPCS